jgi:hypothetical protein
MLSISAQCVQLLFLQDEEKAAEVVRVAREGFAAFGQGCVYVTCKARLRWCFE